MKTFKQFLESYADKLATAKRSQLQHFNTIRQKSQAAENAFASKVRAQREAKKEQEDDQKRISQIVKDTKEETKAKYGIVDDDDD